MKRTFPILAIAVLSLLLVFSACSNQELTEPESDPGEENISLDKEYGGYDTGDEAMAFADDELMDDISSTADAEDPYAGDAEVMDALTSNTDLQSATKVYFLRIAFGLLEGDSSATEVIDWSGSAEVSKGTIVALKTINFEGSDYIVRPRDSRLKLDFVAFTKPYYDGFALAIIDNDTTDEEGEFTLNAGAYSKSLRFSELDSLDLIEPVGAEGHEVSIQSRLREVQAFPGGFIFGRWVKTGNNGGQFKGRWINSLGNNAGFVKGIWGINRFGNKVFKGKYISINGEFRGLLAGQWSYDRNDRVGVFSGRYVNSNRETVGTVSGHFKTGRQNDRRGYFHGRYRTTHNDRSEDPANSDL